MKKKLIVRLLLLCILGLNFQFGNAQDLGIALKILDLENVSFNDGLASIYYKNKYGYIDKDKNIIIPFNYDTCIGFLRRSCGS